MRFELETRATPEQVLTAYTDFSERRPQIWRRTLDPRRYELREQGATWAVAREGTAGSPFWVVCRYDWSTPGEVRWTVVESNYGGGGEGVVRIEALPDGSGSRVRTEWTAIGGSPVQRGLLNLIHSGPTNLVLAKLYKRTLDRFAASGV